MQLSVYRYPNETKLSGYKWELSGGAQGITLAPDGLLTVTPEAESGSYQIQVTSKDDANLTDVMTIQVKGKKTIKMPDLPPCLLMPQALHQAHLHQRVLRIYSNTADMPISAYVMDQVFQRVSIAIGLI